MFCYIKYSVFEVRTLRYSASSNFSSDAHTHRRSLQEKKARVTLQMDFLPTKGGPPMEEYPTNSQRLSNQLAMEKSLLIMQTQRRAHKSSANAFDLISDIDKEDYNSSQMNITEQGDYDRRDPGLNDHNHHANDMKLNEVSGGTSFTESYFSNKVHEPRPSARIRTSVFIKQMGRSKKNMAKSAKETQSMENTTFMINPDCYVRIFIDFIYEHLQIHKKYKIDLCDDYGNLMRLFEMKPYEYAKDRLENRKVYTLVYYEMDNETNQFVILTAMINQSNKTEEQLCLKLKHIMGLQNKNNSLY